MSRYTPISIIIFGITACAQDSGSEGVCAADEIGDPTQEGEDDGCQFIPECAEAEDESPTEYFDLQQFPDLPCDPECPPPPDSAPPEPPHPEWLAHTGTGTYYRYASEEELEINGWAPSTILISADSAVDALVNGTSTSFTFALPLVDATGGIEIESMTIGRKATYHDAWYVTSEDAGVGPVVDAFRPEFHLFLPTWVNLNRLSRPTGTDAFMWAFGDSHGGVTVQAITATQEMFIAGPTIGVWLETLPPGTQGVLVATPKLAASDFDGLMNHWQGIVGGFCSGTPCSWEADVDDEAALEPANCGDTLDNDADCLIDGEDLNCMHRPDYGCDDMDGMGEAHNHRWEDSKDFAVLPDVEWCTTMKDQGMPWHSMLHTNASTAAALINAIPMAFLHFQDEWELPGELPVGVPRVHYRMAYCVFAPSVEDAVDCGSDAEACPDNYELGELGSTLLVDDSQDYFEALWRQYDVAAHLGATEGVSPKPVALLTGVWSGNLSDGTLNETTIGFAASVGAREIDDGIPPYNAKILGASVLEHDHIYFSEIAHETGHSLGLSHTVDADPDPTEERTGFMAYPPAAFAVLGPSLNPAADYQYSDQWTAWQELIVNKQIPRPNAFGHTGCTAMGGQCTGIGSCNTTPGVCWP
jgi:hypothetical protein